MTAFALPSWFGADGFSLSLSVVQRAAASNFGGSEQVRDLMNDRWTATLSASPRTSSDAAALEAFIASMRGMNNTIAVYHLLRPQPQGTMRGNPTLAGGHVQGAEVLQIQSVAGATLRAGDMLGVGGLLLQVAQDSTADGTGLLVAPIVNRLRRALTSGGVVTWNKPTAPFRMASKPPAVQFVPGYAQGVTFDLVEEVTA